MVIDDAMVLTCSFNFSYLIGILVAQRKHRLCANKLLTNCRWPNERGVFTSFFTPRLSIGEVGIASPFAQW